MQPYTGGSTLRSELESYSGECQANTTDMEGSEYSSKKMSHQDRREAISLDIHELENLQKNQEVYDCGNMMRRLEAKIEIGKRGFRLPPKITGIPDVCID